MNLKKIFCLAIYASSIITALYPGVGFAQPPTQPETIDLSPTTTDLSVQFLANIFGVVDGVLHGSGSQIFGAMFGVFNSAVLTLGMALLGYTVFVATLRTAHEGEALGKEWSSIWIPLRTAVGFALMIPKASGYSIIQILVMWVVVQGVGAANLVWGAALDYLVSGGAIVQPQQPPASGGIEMTGNILKSETCMFMLEEALQEEAKATAKVTGDTNSSFVPSFLQSVTSPTLKSQPDFDPKKSKITIYFPGVLFNADGTEYKNFKGACGDISWQGSDPEETDPGAQQVSDARNIAVIQAISGLSTSAQQIALDYGPFPNAKKTALMTLANQDILINAAADYQGLMGPAINAAKAARSDHGLTEFVTQAKAEGWIMAGSYYQRLVNLNKNFSAEGSTYPSTSFKYPISSEIFAVPSIITADTSLTDFFNSASADNTLPTLIKTQSDKASKQADSAKSNASSQYLKLLVGENDPNSAGSGVMANFLAVINPLGTVIASFVQLISQTGEMGANPMSPVTAAAILGSGLIGFVAVAWILGAATMFGVTAVAALCPAANPIGTAIQVVTAWFVPLLTVMLVLAFTMGATLTYYIPMIPYILFLFGGIGWLIAVLESIAAAPLVALGIAYPEEHQVLGKAQPAVMLLTNIFIRPSLMIIGFIAGISLSYVAVWLLNRGFKNALLAITPGTLGWAWIFSPLAILSIYTVLIVEIINRAFSLIHVLPDEVLRWVGGGHRQLGAESSRSEEAVRGGATGDIKSGAQAISQSVGDTQRAKGSQAAKKLELEEGKKQVPKDPGVQQ